MADVLQEPTLIKRAKQGDLDAFGDLLQVFQADANRLAYVITGQTGDAVQDGFVKAWRSLASFDTNRPFRPWLLKIIANEARTRRRSAGRRRELHLQLTETAGNEETREPSPEAMALECQQMQHILDEIEQMPEADEIVLKLRYFLGLSTPEIAAMLDEPAGTIRSRLSRATRKLRECIIEEHEQSFSETTIWRRPANDHEPI